MLSQAVLLSVLLALTEARFGQEQVPIPAISALSNLGASGEAATLAGGDISTLLAAANPCAKLQAGDAILTNLGTSAAAVSAAKGLVAAEQNFNPFVVDVPSICSDPTLPANPLLRGVIPLIDPAVVGSDLENANSATSLTTPFQSDGLSVAQIMANAGFSNFTTKALDGTVGTPSGGAASAASAVVAASSAVSPAASPGVSDDCTDDATTSSVAVVATTAAVATSSIDCNSVPTTLATVAVAATSSAAAASSTTAATSNSTTGVTASTIAGLDFGLCTPTMKFEAGLDGRSDTEFTFQAIDPLVNKGQEEALNPNIITNRICDQLTNVCVANDAAKTACTAAKAQILALGTRDVTTANAWNTALGFEGADTNPDNAPQAGLVGHD